MDTSKITTQDNTGLLKSKEINSPKVSVIVPVYNGAKNLLKLLDKLQQQTYPPELVEIIIADNNSNDDSAQIALQTSGIKVVYEKYIQNAGAARNRALEVATGDIFAFTDSDCLPEFDWIEQGVESLDKSGCDRIAGEVLFSPLSTCSSSAAILDAAYNLNQKFLVDTFQSAVTANLFVYRKVFEAVGLFHTDYFEDMQWNRRASLAGFSIQYESNAIVKHPPRDTLSSLWEKGRRSGRGVFALCQSEQRGGYLGGRHLLRMGRMLLAPRTLHWCRLPFHASELSYQQFLQIQILKWLTINLAETWGYGQWFWQLLIRPTKIDADQSAIYLKN